VRALITGIDGFVGAHLARLLSADGKTEIYGATFLPVENHQWLSALGIQLRQVNLIDASAVNQLLDESQPDHIYHLAAQSFVPMSFENPWATLENNIRGQLNLLHTLAQSQAKTRILVIGSGEEYGAVLPDELPIDEDQPLRPTSPYSVSKVTQDMLAHQYFASHRVAAIRARPFNHIGPGQSAQFVASSFANQIAAIEKGQQRPIIEVGNLEAQRDFTDVRDVVRAYSLLMERGAPGEVYNIGSDRAVTIQFVLDTLLGLARKSIEARVDPARIRPADTPLIVCNSTKLRLATGWQPEYRLETTLADILDDWRARLNAVAA